MNISAISGTGCAGSMQRPPQLDPQQLLSPVADALGMSVSDVQSAMKDGATLQQLASAKGVSESELLDAVKDGLVAARPEGAPSIEGTSRLDEMAAAIVSGRGPGGARGPAGPPPPPPNGANQADDQTLSDVASLLDMSTDDLLQSLLDGTSLRDLADQQGVSFASLRDAVGTGMVYDSKL